MIDREPIEVVLNGEVPRRGLAVEPVTRWVFQDGRKIGRAMAFAQLKPGSPHGWLRIETDEE